MLSKFGEFQLTAFHACVIFGDMFGSFSIFGLQNKVQSVLDKYALFLSYL